MVTRFAASLRTDISPQRKEARPLSHALTSDSFNDWTPWLLVRSGGGAELAVSLSYVTPQPPLAPFPLGGSAWREALLRGGRAGGAGDGGDPQDPHADGTSGASTRAHGGGGGTPAPGAFQLQ